MVDQLQVSGKRWHEFGRYLIVGGVNTFLTYAIYLGGLKFTTYRLAYSVSFVCGILFSYLFNAQFVFRKQLRVVKALQFSMVYVGQYFVGLGLLLVLVEVVHLNKKFAPILLIFLIIPANYWLNRCVIKGRQPVRDARTNS
jgi:putative flippase GtrA